MALSSISQPALSADGRWIAFASFADDLVTNDHNGARDVFIRDLLAGTNSLVSVGTNGDAALGGFSANPVISANGRYVVFVSSATNLIASATNYCVNIFRRDLLTQTTILVSAGSNGVDSADGDCFSPAINGDGRYVVYLSRAKNLAPGLAPGGGGIGANTILRDIDAGTNVALSLTSGQVPPPPSISLDGHYVAYAEFVNPSFRLRVWDRLLSQNVYTNPVTSLSSMAISPTGTRLLYHAQTTLRVADFIGKTNITSFTQPFAIQSSQPWSTNGRFFGVIATKIKGTEVDLYDLQNAQLTPVSTNPDQVGATNDWPALSGDGRFVLYRSFATNTLLPNLFVYDRLTGSNSLFTTGPVTPDWSLWISKPGVSMNGVTAAFAGWNAGPTSGDLNRASDVFSQTVDAAVDSDGDGMTDTWMQQYFGHATGQAGDQSRAQDDADGDGMTNLEEFTMGTDPTNAASALRIQISYVATGTNVTLTWPAAPGRTYKVQFRDDLADPAWLDLSETISINGGVAQLTTTAAQAGRYYRVIGTN